MKERRRLPVEECLNIGIALAAALEHLHKNELIHRDVKPGNIIFVNGLPKLADIGLVGQIGGDSFVGTEGYIPPEGPGKVQGDIYSLGKVLYEISTGKGRMEFPEVPPDLGAESRDLPSYISSLRRWFRKEPTPAVSQGNRLHQIVLKACHHDIEMRYGCAPELADALRLLEA
jgi:serine/threonine protein kinase